MMPHIQLFQPNVETYNPDPVYLRELIAKTSLSQNDTARQIGIGLCSLRWNVWQQTRNIKHA